jgi:hypothetical protein
MALIDDFDVNKLLQAHLEILQLEAAAIDRACLHLEATGKPYENFKNENGFSVKVDRDSLLDTNFVDVRFYQTDVQGRGETKAVTVPRSVIFGELTVEEKEFEEYKRLKAKFEK